MVLQGKGFGGATVVIRRIGCYSISTNSMFGEGIFLLKMVDR